MRCDVQDIFRITPHEKQVMMFSATLSKEIRPVCRKFMQDVREREMARPRGFLHLVLRFDHFLFVGCAAHGGVCR